MTISKRAAKKALIEGQGDKPFDILDNLDGELTDDEEINKEIQEIALGRLNLSKLPIGKLTSFDPDDSYFSETDEKEKN